MKYLLIIFVIITLDMNIYADNWQNTSRAAQDVYTVSDFQFVVDHIINGFKDLNCKVINITSIEWETHKEYYELIGEPKFFILPILGRDYILENITRRLFTVWLSAYYFEDNSFIMVILWFSDSYRNGSIHQALYIMPSN